MIHSSVNDNWMRVVIIHSVAREYFDSTHGTDFRQRMTSGGDFFPFDTSMYDMMEKESCIVGMVMAWAVVTLESLVNHALAEAINNKLSAIMAIEYPGQITQKLKVKKPGSSELANKLAILSDSLEPNADIIELADKLAKTRNSIVHDKPFNLIDYGDGEVEIENRRSRGEPKEGQIKYEELKSFFKNCDQIKDFIARKTDLDTVETSDFCFSSLING